MARGRKKGGIKINEIEDKNTLQNMIINQINSLNKKIKAFNNEGIEEHKNFVNTMVGNLVTFTDNGTISKSKKNFENKSLIMLKKTLASLIKTNNNDFYGTVRKYHTQLTRQVRDLQDYVKEYLQDKGYDDDFIFRVINDKSYIANIFTLFNDDNFHYDSDSTIEKVTLNYDNGGMTKKQANKILSNIERSRNALDKIREEKAELEEYRRNKKMR